MARLHQRLFVAIRRDAGQLLSEALGRPAEGWSVVEEASELRAPLASRAWDCVVMLHDPPRLDALERLRGWGSGPVVVLTDDRSLHREAYRLGASACLERAALRPGELMRLVDDAEARFAAAPTRPGSPPRRCAPEELEALWRHIEHRMGVVPTFFELARGEPAIARSLFGLAEFAYLDNPLPAQFKELLFTFLSRACAAPYCMARHCAFLLGRGHVAGDPNAERLTLEEATQILEEPFPSAQELEEALRRLARRPGELERWPSWRSELGRDLRTACAQIFLEPDRAATTLEVLRRSLGEQRCEWVLLLLAFIRTAHFWTELHPALRFDADVEALLREHHALAVCLARAAETPLREHVRARVEIEVETLRQRVADSRLLRQLADAVPAFIARVDVDYRYTFVNQTYHREFAEPHGALEGKRVADVLGPENFLKVHRYLEAALRGEASRTELQVRLPKQGMRDLNLTYTPDRDPDGVVTGCFVLVVDVTERRDAERRLIDSERALAERNQQLEGLFEHAPAGLVLFDAAPPYRVLAHNRVYQRFWSEPFRSAGMLGRYLSDYASNAEEAGILAVFREVARTRLGQTLLDFPYTDRERGQTWWSWTLSPIVVDDEVTAFAHMLIETTDAVRARQLLEAEIAERARVELSLRVSEERFRVLADAMPQLVWTARADGTIVYYNSRASQYDGAQRLDGQWCWSTIVHPDEVEASTRAWAEARQSGRTYDREHRMRMADGSYRWHLSRAVACTAQDGTLQWFGTATDVHELKQAQELLSEADRRKNEFLAMLGHELRNPLAAIRNATELVRLVHSDDVRIERAHAVLQRQSSHMSKLLDGLLDVTRITRGILEIDKVETDLRPLLQDVLSDHEVEARRRGVVLRTELDGVSLPVLADPARLTQVFSNLVGNALKFTPAGGIVSVQVERGPDQVRVRVRDTGVGFSPETQELLFEPFQQGPQDIARSSGGLGLGLSLVKGLLELHDGSIGAHSDGLGCGAEFEARLPLARR